MLSVNMTLENDYHGEDTLTISVYTGKSKHYERKELFPREYTKGDLRRILERCTSIVISEVQQFVDKGEL